MKQLAFLFLIFSFISASAQDNKIKVILENVKRDSTDKTCKLLFYDFYNCFESDQGQANPKMINATISLFNYQSNPALPNKQLVILLFQYIKVAAEPEVALKWIQALNDEYKSVYGETNPLIMLYKGESLEQANHKEEAYTHFRVFLKEYPQSVTALVNVFGTEKDEKLRKVWFDKLKNQYPNNWAVKNLKME